MIREKWSWHDQQYFEVDFSFYRVLWHSYIYDEEISDVINKTVRQRIRTVLGFVESCDTHVTVTVAWWTPVIHHALDAWFRHTARVTLAMDTAFVTLVSQMCNTLLVLWTCYTARVLNVLHCSCDRRVMLLAPCYALLCDAPELVDHAIASCPLVDHKTQQKIQKQILWSPSPQINQHQVPHIAIVSCTGACGDLVIGNQPIGDQELNTSCGCSSVSYWKVSDDGIIV